MYRMENGASGTKYGQNKKLLEDISSRTGRYLSIDTIFYPYKIPSGININTASSISYRLKLTII